MLAQPKPPPLVLIPDGPPPILPACRLARLITGCRSSTGGKGSSLTHRRCVLEANGTGITEFWRHRGPATHIPRGGRLHTDIQDDSPNKEGDIMLVRSSFEGSCRGGGRAVGDDRASGGVGDEGGGLDAVL